MNLKINKITCLRMDGYMDILYLETDLPNGCWPFEGMQIIKMEIVKGSAEGYCLENFPDVPLKVKKA